MRIALVVLLLGAIATIASAQDPGQMATQQAAQAAQQATQAAQEANQQAIQNAQTAAQTTWGPGLAAAPKFSVKPGTYSSAVTVRITDSTRDAVIYYTTDGWTPTQDSPVYRGPITIDRNTTLQAIAVAPYNYRSVVAVAKYTVNLAPGTSSNTNPDANAAAIVGANPPVASDGVAKAGPVQQSADAAKNGGAAKGSAPEFLLQQDTPVSLLFDDALTSKTAQVGDTIHLSVAEDVSSDGTVIVPKGTRAIATVVAINHTGPGGAPGDISFEADSMTVRGTLVKLYGCATREGQAHLPNAAVLIPVVGPFTAFRHGTDAVIDKGTPFTAFVDSNTQLAVLSK